MIPFDIYNPEDTQKPKLLLLPGAGVLDTFSHQYAVLAEKYQIFICHMPGCGERTDVEYSPDKTVSDIVELAESLGGNIALAGHSLGAQTAVRLVCKRPDLFTKAVFLSRLALRNENSIEMYAKISKMMAVMLKNRQLVTLQGKFWGFTRRQTERMAEYLQSITPAVYSSFFKNTLDICELPEYPDVKVPMLAVCGLNEVADMKKSLRLLSENKNCRCFILPKTNHDFPMRNPEKINPLLVNFLS